MCVNYKPKHVAVKS